MRQTKFIAALLFHFNSQGAYAQLPQSDDSFLLNTVMTVAAQKKIKPPPSLTTNTPTSPVPPSTVVKRPSIALTPPGVSPPSTVDKSGFTYYSNCTSEPCKQ